jgi:hypothetical protein
MTDISKASETLEASLEYVRSLEDLGISPEVVLTINCGSATTVLQSNVQTDRMSVLLGFAQADLQPTLREVA